LRTAKDFNTQRTRWIAEGNLWNKNAVFKANSAFYPSGVSKWVPASAGKAKAGMVHSVRGCARGVIPIPTPVSGCH